MKAIIWSLKKVLSSKDVKIVTEKEKVLEERLFQKNRGVMIVVNFFNKEDDDYHIFISPPINLKKVISKISKSNKVLSSFIESNVLKRLVKEKIKPLIPVESYNLHYDNPHAYHIWGLIELLEEKKIDEFKQKWEKVTKLVLILTKFFEKQEVENLVKNELKDLTKKLDKENSKELNVERLKEKLALLDKYIIAFYRKLKR